VGERKRRLAAGQGLRHRFDRALIATALRALEAGDRAGAENAFERLVAAVPDDLGTAAADDFDALHACGVIALQLGRTARAEALLVKANALRDRDAALHCHLAIAYRRLGKADAAIGELEKALALDPALAAAHSNLGNLLLERGDHEAALHSFERALVIRQDYPEALNGLGDAQRTAGHYERACTNLERAIALDPVFHEAWYNLSRARAQWAAALGGASGAEVPPQVSENAERALESILSALQINADNAAYWTQFESCVGDFDLRHPIDPRLHSRLLEALEHPAVDPSALARPIVSVVMTHPDMQAIERSLVANETIDEVALPEFARRASSVLGDALARRLLEGIVVPNALIQSLCAVTRGALLAQWARDPAADPAVPLDCVAAIAQQAFNTEYVNGESAAESEWVARLARSIAEARADSRAVPLHWCALYGCYRTLHQLDAAEEIASEVESTPLHALAERQIGEPLEERRLRSAIPQLTQVSDVVSEAVKDQYEANPYPRWLRIRSGEAQRSVAAFLRSRFPGADIRGLDDASGRILIAGCGTGRHPISTALRFPDARILALDLSKASLAYALRKTRALGIGNVEYAQADILELDSLAERFPVIECTGVLHHLKDPIAGWRTLGSLLVPGGVMRVGLYSDIARRHVVRAREVVAAEGFPPTPDGIRAFRRFVLAHDGDPLLARFARSEDFYSMSGLRDLVFNVQEHRFALPQVAAMLSELRFEFLGFELSDPAAAPAYRARFPGDPALTSLDNWHAFEDSRPDTFARMYQFWVRKPRRTG